MEENVSGQRVDGEAAGELDERALAGGIASPCGGTGQAQRALQAKGRRFEPYCAHLFCRSAVCCGFVVIV
jgi:hypothetical protein